MKIIGKTVIPLFLAIILTACDGIASTPTISQINVMGTAVSIVNTKVVLTQIAIPTATGITPTSIPPMATRIPSDVYAGRIDYAMATAPKIYSLLPYINEITPYGEYSGCVESNDFHNFVGYELTIPIETVKTAFVNYFQKENWEFTEVTPGLVGYDNNIPTITYDVYRISSKDIPAFERLRISLTDETAARGSNYVRVRSELTHVENKENLRYLLDPLTCYYNGLGWQWIRLTK